MTAVSKLFFSMVAQSLWSHYRSRGIKMAKIQMARAYIVGVRELRKNFQAIGAIVVCLLLMIAGFILFVMGVSALLPLTPEGRAWVLTIVGGIALFGPLFTFIRLNSEKNWIEKAHVDDVLDAVVKRHDAKTPYIVKSETAVS